MTGAEAVSRVTDKGWSASSTSEKVNAAIAVAAVLPVGRAVEGAEGLARGADAAKVAAEGAGGAKAAMDASGVLDALKGLQAGRSSGVNIVDSTKALNNLFGKMSAGGKLVEGSKYPGKMIELSDGTTVGLRQVSKSGGPTIDIKLPDTTLRKVHVQQ